MPTISPPDDNHSDDLLERERERGVALLKCVVLCNHISYHISSTNSGSWDSIHVHWSEGS
jgi:hypothetical protein